MGLLLFCLHGRVHKVITFAVVNSSAYNGAKAEARCTVLSPVFEFAPEAGLHVGAVVVFTSIFGAGHRLVGNVSRISPEVEGSDVGGLLFAVGLAYPPVECELVIDGFHDLWCRVVLEHLTGDCKRHDLIVIR